MKQKITFLFLGFLFTSLTYAQDPKFQVIHNAADAALSTVDVYVTTPLSTEKAIEDVAFRTASPFKEGVANIGITIKIAPGNSTSVNEAFYEKALTLESGKTYIIIAEGINSSTGYTPAKPFELYIYETGRETASNSSNTDVLVHHGVTDAPTVDINNVTGGTSSVLVDNISYSEYNTSYLELPTSDYQINVSTADGATVLKTYSAPLATLGLTGQAITVVASGFLDPTVNSNGSAFGLWAATAAGGDLVELQEVLSVDKFDFSVSSVFPNPAANNFTISLDKFEGINATIFDTYGRNVKSLNLTNTKTNVNVSNLASGLYFVQLSNNTSKSKAIKVLFE